MRIARVYELKLNQNIKITIKIQNKKFLAQ